MEELLPLVLLEEDEDEEDEEQGGNNNKEEGGEQQQPESSKKQQKTETETAVTAPTKRRKWPFADIITHRLPLSQGVEAYRMFDQKRDGCIKVVLEPFLL